MAFLWRRRRQRQKESRWEIEPHAGFRAAAGQMLNDYESVSSVNTASRHVFSTIKHYSLFCKLCALLCNDGASVATNVCSDVTFGNRILGLV